MTAKSFSLLLIALILSWFTWITVGSIRNLVLQYQAQSFSSTQGKIESSDVVEYSGSKGRTYYRPSFTYSYQVNGLDYEESRYRYDGRPSYSDRDSAEDVVAAHLQGSAILVYYNPKDPSDAVLSPRVDVSDVTEPFMFAVVDFIFLNLLIDGVNQMNWPGRTIPVAGGVKIITKMMKTRVRLPRYRPSKCGLIAAGILSFAAAIIIQLTGGSYPPLSAGMWALGLTIVAGATAYFWQYQRINSGAQDLVIDEGSRTVELPLTFARTERMHLAYSDIQSVTLEEVAHQTRYRSIYAYAPTLQPRDGAPQRLAEMSQERAVSFAAWLREKFGIPASVPVLDEQ